MSEDQKKNTLTTGQKLKSGFKLIQGNQSISAGFTILFAILIIIIIFQFV